MNAQVKSLVTIVLAASCGFIGCAVDGADEASAAAADTTASLLGGAAPMPCADPTVFSERNAGATFYVYCTSLMNVWRTTDWQHFTDVQQSTTYNLAGMSDNGQIRSAWWAPGIVYDPALGSYVMWVSVPAALARMVGDNWDTRELAVLVAQHPVGPWTFRGIAVAASSEGRCYIDPFLFLDRDGRHYVLWKQYGGTLSSSIMGAEVDAAWGARVAGSQVEIVHGYGGAGSWEMSVRENPALWREPGTNRYHLLYSGGYWNDDSYATGHAVSTCGPLCTNSTHGGWHVASSAHGVAQVVEANGDPHFALGGPGGAQFGDDSGRTIVFAAAARSASGDSTRYLMRDRVAWRNDAPFVNTLQHRPAGL
jgi:hypothetical protein